MAARGSSSRYTHISLGSVADKIQLNGRQMQLLQNRRQRLDGGVQAETIRPSVAKPKSIDDPSSYPVKPVSEEQPNPVSSQSWAHEPTRTAPTASWESSSVSEAPSSRASSVASGGGNPQQHFYGQALKSNDRKKLYDDTGASYYDSVSEASSAAPSTTISQKKLESSSTALTECSTMKESSSHDSRTSEAQIEAIEEEPPSSTPEPEAPSRAASGTNEVDMAHLKKRLRATMAEKRKEQGKPLAQPSEKQKDRRASFGLNRPKASGKADDPQRALLRKLMQSAYPKDSSKQAKKEDPKDEIESEHSSQSNSKLGRFGWSKRKSIAGSSARSGSSTSSVTEDKAIMRKVLERRKEKMASKPRKQNVLKSSASRVKKALSPRSRTSEESANDERSISDQPRRASLSKKTQKTPSSGKKKSRKFGRSPRILSTAARWSNDADDEATLTEESSTERDESVKLSANSILESLPAERTQNPAKEQEPVASEEDKAYQQEAVDHVPELMQPGQRIAFDDDYRMSDRFSVTSRSSIISRPSILTDGGIEIQACASSLSNRFARAVTESLMESVDLISPKPPEPVVETVDEKSDIVENEEPEGYAEFVATLKAEASGSHSLLWKSFHHLFNGENSQSAPFLSKASGDCRFDDKTKDMVTNMSTYLKETYEVDCAAGTQLANDKAVRENPVSTPVFGQHMLKITAGSFDDYDSDKENSGDQSQVDSMGSINDDPDDTNAFEVTLKQFVRKSIGGPREKTPVVASFVPMTNNAATLKIYPSNISKPTLPDNESETRGIQTTPQARTEASIPWSGVKLKSIVDTGKSEATSSSIPTSWAKVKLRRITVKEDKDKPDDVPHQPTPTEDDDESADFRRILVSKKKSSPTPKAQSQVVQENEVIEIIDLADMPSTEGCPIDLTRAGEPIDLTNAPIDTPQTPMAEAQSHADTMANATAVTADGSVLVSLAPEPNTEPVKILIGKKGIVKIRSKPGETKATVIWRHDLEDVRSALLDLSTFKVKLLLDSDHKDLAFSTSEQCMRFANALHEWTNSEEREDEPADESIAAEDSVFVEQLNEEEQRVLEEFRQSKRQVNVSAQHMTIETDADKPMSVINADTHGVSSPLSEVSGPGSSLTSGALKIAHSYQNMLKLRIPKDEVRHKMEEEKVDSKIVEYVLGVEAGVEASESSENGDGLNPMEQEAALKFQKMLKMRIPSEAVQHQMEKEGIDAKVMSVVLGKANTLVEQHAAAAPTLVKSSLNPDDERIAQPYRKMLKMMIPKEAVQHKMAKDQIGQHIIVAVVGESKTASNTAKAKPAMPTLNDEEESIASSYRKMVSLRIPKEAIRKKMDTEGISKKIIASVLGEKVIENGGSGNAPIKRGGKQGFHWSPLVSSANLKNSVWSKSSFDSGFIDDDDDLSSHVEMFQKKPDSDDASRVTAKSSSDGKEMAKLIDLGRANNVAITLKAFNEFSHGELSQIIEFVDPFQKIKGDRALFMKDLLPAVAEIKVIKSYAGETSRLVPAERWFRQIVHIKRVEEKIHVMRTMESFKNEAVALGETFEMLTNVCNQVMNSEKLPDLLEMVRQIGNRMNNGRGEEAAGFKLDFLPRLAQTKGSDKNTTALDLVVMVFNTRGRRRALMLRDDFPDCHYASRIQVGELITDVKMLGIAMKKCQKELDMLRKENGTPVRARSKLPMGSKSDSGILKPLSNKSSSEDEVRTEVSSMHQEMFAKRANLINSVLHGAAATQDDKGDDESEGMVSPRMSLLAAQMENKIDPTERSYDRQGAINRIESFLAESNLVFPELETKRKKAIDACKELSEFFCEPGGERIAPILLGILSEFATNLDRAVQKYDHQQKAEARKKKSSKEKPSDAAASSAAKVSKSKRTKASAAGEKKSLVLMVNEMLKIAGDKQKDDFLKGLTYEHPDTRLKQIYQAEETTGKPVGSPRKNILRAIEERQHLHGPHDSQMALSELAQAMQKRPLSTDSMSPKASDTESIAGGSLADTSDVSTTSGSELKSEVITARAPKKKYRRSIADRWTRKVDADEEIGDCLTFQPSKSAESVSDTLEIDRSDSQILAADSHDSEDRKYEERKRNQYISRWASQNTMLRSNSKDCEEESDVSGSLEFKTKTRQKYMSRWASKPEESEE